MTRGLDRPRVALAVVLAAPGLLVGVRGGRPAVLAASVAGTAGLMLVHDLLRAAGRRSVSTATTLLVLLGTPLVWYEIAEPGRAVLAFLGSAIAARAWWAWRERPPALEGVAVGLLLAALALAAGALPVAVRRPALLESLFASTHGVLFWTPMLTVATIALAVAAVRGRPRARAMVIALVLLAVAVAAMRPWAVGAVSNARVLPALPLMALGLADALEAVRDAARRRPLRILAAAGAALVVWNLLFMVQYRREMIPRDDTVSFPAVAENAALLVSARVGSPPAWPANWLFAARSGEKAARWDGLGGRDLLAELPARIDIGDLDSDAALLAGDWSVRHRCLDAVCREVEGSARVLIPVVDPRPFALQVRALGSGTLRVRLGGVTAAGALGPGFTEVRLTVPRAAVRAGANALVVDVSPGARALVDSVLLLPTDRAP